MLVVDEIKQIICGGWHRITINNNSKNGGVVSWIFIRPLTVETKTGLSHMMVRKEANTELTDNFYSPTFPSHGHFRDQSN